MPPSNSIVHATSILTEAPSTDGRNVFGTENIDMFHNLIPAAYGAPPNVYAFFVPRGAWADHEVKIGATPQMPFGAYGQLIDVFRANFFRSADGICTLVCLAVPRGRSTPSGEAAGYFFIMYERAVPASTDVSASERSVPPHMIVPDAEDSKVGDAESGVTTLLDAVMVAATAAIRSITEIADSIASSGAPPSSAASDTDGDGDVPSSVPRISNRARTIAAMRKLVANTETAVGEITAQWTRVRDWARDAVTNHPSYAMDYVTDLTRVMQSIPVEGEVLNIRTPHAVPDVAFQACTRAVRTRDILTELVDRVATAACGAASESVDQLTGITVSAKRLLLKRMKQRSHAIFQLHPLTPMTVWMREALWASAKTVSATARPGVQSEWAPVVDLGVEGFIHAARLASWFKSTPPAQAHSSSGTGVTQAATPVNLDAFCKEFLSLRLAYDAYVTYSRALKADNRGEYFTFDELFSPVMMDCGRVSDGISRAPDQPSRGAGGGRRGAAREDDDEAEAEAEPEQIPNMPSVVHPVTVPSRDFIGCVTVFSRGDVARANWDRYLFPQCKPAAARGLRVSMATTRAANNVSTVYPGLAGFMAHNFVARGVGAHGAADMGTINLLATVHKHANAMASIPFTTSTRERRDSIVSLISSAIASAGDGIPAAVATHINAAARIGSTPFDIDHAGVDGLIVGLETLIAFHAMARAEVSIRDSRAIPHAVMVRRVIGVGGQGPEEFTIRNPVVLTALARPYTQWLHTARATNLRNLADPSVRRYMEHGRELTHAQLAEMVTPTRDTTTLDCGRSDTVIRLFGGEVAAISSDSSLIAPGSDTSVHDTLFVCRTTRLERSGHTGRAAPMAFTTALVTAAMAHGMGVPHNIDILIALICGLAGVTALGARPGDPRPALVQFGSAGTGKSFSFSELKKMVPVGAYNSIEGTSTHGMTTTSEVMCVSQEDEGTAALGINPHAVESYTRTLLPPVIQQTAGSATEVLRRAQLQGDTSTFFRAAVDNGRIVKVPYDVSGHGVFFYAGNFPGPDVAPEAIRSRVRFIPAPLINAIAELYPPRIASTSCFSQNRKSSLGYVASFMHQVHAFSANHALLERAHVVPATTTTITTTLTQGVRSWSDRYGIAFDGPRVPQILTVFARAAMMVRVTATVRMLCVHPPTRGVDLEAGRTIAPLCVTTVEDTCVAMDAIKPCGSKLHHRILDIISEMLVARLVYDEACESEITDAPGINGPAATQFPAFGGAGSSHSPPPAPGSVHADTDIDGSVKTVAGLCRLVRSAAQRGVQRKPGAMTGNGFVRLTNFVVRNGSGSGPGEPIEMHEALRTETSSGSSRVAGAPATNPLASARVLVLNSFCDQLMAHPTIVSCGIARYDVWGCLGWLLREGVIPGVAAGNRSSALAYRDGQIYANIKILVAVLAAPWHIAACASVSNDVHVYVPTQTASAIDGITTARGDGGSAQIDLLSPAFAITPLTALPSGTRSDIHELTRVIETALYQATVTASGPPPEIAPQKRVQLVTGDAIDTAHWSHLLTCFDNDADAARRSFAYLPTLQRLADSAMAIRVAIATKNGARVCDALHSHFARLAKTSDGCVHPLTELDVACYLRSLGSTCGLSLTMTPPAPSGTGSKSGIQQWQAMVSGACGNFTRLAHAAVSCAIKENKRHRGLATDNGDEIDYDCDMVRTAMKDYWTLSENCIGFVHPVATDATRELFAITNRDAEIDELMKRSVRQSAYPARFFHDWYTPEVTHRRAPNEEDEDEEMAGPAVGTRRSSPMSPARVTPSPRPSSQELPQFRVPSVDSDDEVAQAEAWLEAEAVASASKRARRE